MEFVYSYHFCEIRLNFQTIFHENVELLRLENILKSFSLGNVKECTKIRKIC